MIRLPISAKVALWSFVIAAITMGGATLVTTLVLERELMVPVDELLSKAAADIFSTLNQYTDRADGGLPPITEEMLPPRTRYLHSEILGADGQLLYRAPNMKNKLTMMGGPDEAHVVQFFKQPNYVRPFHQGKLTLLLAYPLTANYQTLARVKTSCLYALPVVGLLSLLGGYWLAGRALKPVRRITAAAARITANDLHQRLPLPKTRDEIRLLTIVLNGTFERLERSYLQAMRFASDASHQLKTPVTVIRAGIEDLLRDSGIRPEQVAVLNDLMEQTRRLTSLSEGLLLLAQADAGRIDAKPREIDIVPTIQRCIEDAEILASNMDIKISTEIPTLLRAVADSGRTEQVLLNLLENAVKYNRRHGAIAVRAGQRKDAVFITVANTGKSIPPDRVPWIFDRFARGETDESRAGHGLGLAIARELAVAQGGDVRLLRSDGEWTEFEIRLAPPAAQKADGWLTPLMTPPPTRALVRNAG